MAIARFPSIVIDCPDPGALATFYGAMLDWKAEISSDWADVRADYGQCISFQQVEGYAPPRWPGQDVPQQMHLDVVVDDLDAAEAAVLEVIEALPDDEYESMADVMKAYGEADHVGGR